LNKSVFYLTLELCRPRKVYVLNSRNLKCGVFTEQGYFIGIRLKFNSVFLDKEVHYDRGGTAKPLYEIGSIPESVKLSCSLGTIDSLSGRNVIFDKPIADGGKGWLYEDSMEPADSIMPTTVHNEMLYKILKDFDVVKISEVS